MKPDQRIFKTGQVATIACAHLLPMVQKLPSLLNPLIGIIADRMVIRSGIILAPLVTMVVLSLLGVAPSIICLMVLLFVCGMSAPVFMAMIQDLKSSRPAFANGLLMTVRFAASSIVALSVGFLADRYGFVKTYQIAALLSLCALPFTFAIKDHSHG